MSEQLSFGYKPAYAAIEAWTRHLEAIRAAVNYLGLKEVSFELDVSNSMLCDALGERPDKKQTKGRKRWAAKWTHTVKAMLVAKQDPIAHDMARSLLECDRLTIPDEIAEGEPLTPEDLAAIARLLRERRTSRGGRRR